MLERLLQGRRWSSGGTTLKRIEYLAGSLGLAGILSASLGLAGISCRTTSCQSPSYSLEHEPQQHSESDKEKLSAVFNDLHSEPEKYAGAVSLWPRQEEIWPALATKEARERFVSFVLSRDKIDKEKYLYDEPDDPDYLPCPLTYFNGPDDPHYRDCLAYRADNIDKESPMTCRHFTRKLYWAYGKAGQIPPVAPAHSRYKIPIAYQKYFLPMREIEIIFPESILRQPDGSLTRKRSRPHSVAAVWLADQPMVAVSRKEFNNPNNWYFFDPKLDYRLFTAPANYQLNPGKVFLIHPYHYLPLDKATNPPGDSYKDDYYQQVLAFAVNQFWELIPAAFLDTRELTQLVYEQAAHHKNLPLILEKMHQMYWIDDAQLPERIMAAAAASRNFTEIELSSIYDWQTYLMRTDNPFISLVEHNFVQSFLSERADYFSHPQNSSFIKSPQAQATFAYLEQLGILRPEEIYQYQRQGNLKEHTQKEKN